MPQPLRLATRSLCIGVAFVTPNRLPTGMPYRHPSTKMEYLLLEYEHFIKFNLVVSADRGGNIGFTLSAF